VCHLIVYSWPAKKLMKALEVIASTRTLRWAEMAREWRLLREGPPLLK
jgi:hypothetical protein